ncbi:MAG TPA: hypothetical protein VGE01_09875 [Fimbriimonas sp.]
MKRNWLPRAVLFAAAEYLLLPYLVWRLVSLWIPSADVRGPFLVASPFIAISFVFLPIARYTWLRFLEPRNPQPGPEELQKVVTSYAETLGRTGIEVVRGADGSLYLRDSERTTKVSTSDWGDLDDGQRRFLIARTLAHTFGRQPRRWGHALHTAAMAAGMAIAALNLWYVLAAHASLAGLMAFEGFAPMKRRTVEADLAALRLTRNLSAAVEAVRRAAPGSSLVDPDERIEALRREASAMGLG